MKAAAIAIFAGLVLGLAWLLRVPCAHPSVTRTQAVRCSDGKRLEWVRP